MVKADAYGHGIVQVARALAACGTDYFGVADISEARQIRGAGIDTPILIMGYTAPENLGLLKELGLTQTVFSAQFAGMLADSGIRGIKCHLKIDTGMGRLGFVCREGRATREVIDALSVPGLDYEGIFTHFACADDPASDMTLRQLDNFNSVTASLEELGFKFRLRHAAASSGILNYPQSCLDMVRPGIALYGHTPDGGKNPALRPAMELYGTVEAVKDIKKGDTVSYGASYVSPRDQRIAAVTLGYADGVSRSLSNRGHVLIRGRRAPILGKVCMDCLLAGIDGIDGVEYGTPAYIIGGGENGNSAEEIAGLENTISYEILCRIVYGRVVKEYTFE